MFMPIQGMLLGVPVAQITLAEPAMSGNAWAPRIAQGMDTLIDYVLNGFTDSAGVMPMKGERLDRCDEEIIGAVEYMVEQAAQQATALAASIINARP
jgi:cytochrome c5